MIWYSLTKTDKNQNERDLKTTRAEAQGWDYVGPGSSLEDEKEMKGSERTGVRGFVDGVMVQGTIQRGSILYGEKPESIPVWGGGKGEGEMEAAGLWEKLKLNTQR